MFGLFKGKDKKIKILDKIWLSEEAKFSACLELILSEPKTIFIVWFGETKKRLEKYFDANNQSQIKVCLADHLNSSIVDRQIVFVEHHPLQREEQRIADLIGLNEMTVYSSLTEPFFKLFNSDNIISLAKKMGMRDDEMLESGMIGNSIKNAQEKIATKVSINPASNSQENWLLTTGLSATSFS